MQHMPKGHPLLVGHQNEASTKTDLYCLRVDEQLDVAIKVVGLKFTFFIKIICLLIVFPVHIIPG